VSEPLVDLVEMKTIRRDLDLGAYDFLKEVPFLKIHIFGNTLYSYILTIAACISLWALLVFVRNFLGNRLERRAKARGTTKARQLATLAHQMISSMHSWFLPFLAISVSIQRLAFSAPLEKGIKYLTLTLVTWQVIRFLCEAVSFFLIQSRLKSDGQDDLAARNSAENLNTLIKIILWVTGALFLLDNFGVNISTFVAGLGIGGIAIALAAQALLGDAFSSFAIAMDKPFQVGDFIIIDTLQGTVEHIGLKTTRVRSLSGELLIFGNSDLTKSRIRNYQKMSRRRINFQIGLTYDTSIENLKKSLTIIKSAIEGCQLTTFDRAHFFKFDAYALTYDIVYYVNSSDYTVYMNIQQEINFTILNAFLEKGINMAFPTQTIITHVED
jgi:small-conductance mechanosensitive channel